MKTTYAAGTAGLIIILALAACQGLSTAPAVSDTVKATPSFASDIQPIFNASCTGCHGTSGGLDLTSGRSYAALVNVRANGDPTKFRVAPEDATNSYLVMALENRATNSGKMPPSGSLTGNQIQNIKNWINTGAANN